LTSGRIDSEFAGGTVGNAYIREQMFTYLNFWVKKSLLLLTKGGFFGIIKVPRVYIFFFVKKSQEYTTNCAQDTFSEIKHFSTAITAVCGVGQNVPGVGQNVPPP